jgi:hypothetical protein
MQDLKKAQTIHSQDPTIDTQTRQPAYMPPKITVYKEEELLKTATVLGCSGQSD